MASESDLIQQFASAQRALTRSVDPTPYAALDRDAAYRVLTGTMAALGETAGMLKTAIVAGGGVAAPIFASRVGDSGALQLPSQSVVGLEVEVGLVLKADIDMAAARDDEINVVDGIGRYFVGVEIVGTRFTDRSKAGVFGGLADNMGAFGYCINPMHRDMGADIAAYDVKLEFGGSKVFEAPAKHSFGTVLASLIAYARDQHPALPLKAGTIITTGSLCGLVPTSGPGHVRAQFGNHVVELELV